MPVPSRWHPGEIAAQQARGFEDAAWGGYMGYEEGAPSFMAAFLSNLPFLSVTTLDEDGMPWASLICNDGQTGFMQQLSDYPISKFSCTIQAPQGVPIRRCLLRLQRLLNEGRQPYDEGGDARPEFQLAAVGVMLHNRRRNKMEGVIASVQEAPASEADNRFVFELDVSTTFGNCPKYINTRQLSPVQGAQATPTTTHGDGTHLPANVLSILAATDMLFLASKHSGVPDSYPLDPPRLGNNIRGGAPGFLRAYYDDEAQRQALILPDWSGNRLMQSFGNITGDSVAGITVPVWSSKTGRPSDLLHLTCDAQVVASEEASQLMRGIQGAVKLWPRSWSLVQAGLPLTEAKDSIGWSPYNPPVRLLNSEMPSLATRGVARPIASLVGVHFYSPVIATFTFSIDTPLTYDPGQHIVLDCYRLLDTRVQMYTHMAQYRGGEKDLNDDGTRSWTISYASSTIKSEVQQIEVTLRRKERGGVTPGLFRRGWLLREEGQDESNVLTVDVLGLGGSCFLPLMEHPRAEALQVSYLLSGIGLTPMLPHLSQLAQSDLHHARVLAIVAVKWDEVEVTKKLIRRALTRSEGSTILLHLDVFLLAGNVPEGLTEGEQAQEDESGENLPSNFTINATVVRGKRLQPSSLSVQGDSTLQDFDLPEERCRDLQRASQVVVCAGTAFSRTAAEALRQAEIADSVVKMESFSF